MNEIDLDLKKRKEGMEVTKTKRREWRGCVVKKKKERDGAKSMALKYRVQYAPVQDYASLQWFEDPDSPASMIMHAVAVCRHWEDEMLFLVF